MLFGTLPQRRAVIYMVLLILFSNIVLSPLSADDSSEQFLFYTPTYNQVITPTKNSSYVKDQLLVSFKENVVVTTMDDNKLYSNDVRVRDLLQILNVKQAKLLYRHRERNWDLMPAELRNVYMLELSPYRDILEVITYFEQLETVNFAEPNYTRGISREPNDGLYNQQVGLRVINAESAWDMTIGSLDVKIAIIDSGIDISHPDLIDKITDGYDYVDNDPIPDDTTGHGTHVAGIAAASADNGGLGTDVVGTSWLSPIVPLKVCRDDSDDGCTTSDITAAIIDAVETEGVRVINLSIEGPNYSENEQTAIEYARLNGITVVAAAGNDREDNNETLEIAYPAAYDYVIAVGAADNLGENILPFSRLGCHIDLVAPGLNILSTAAWNTSGGAFYEERTGTSMAAPFVSGVAALIYSVLSNPSHEPQTAIEVERILKTTATDEIGHPGNDSLSGFGLLNARKALIEAAKPQMYLPIMLSGTIGSAASTSVLPTSKIAYASAEFSACEDVVVMNNDGSNKVSLETGVPAFEPNWSPDGSRLVFVGSSIASQTDEIYIINADGTGLTQLTYTPDEYEYVPSWSPDGTQIAYSSSPVGSPTTQDIFVMQADGSNKLQLTFHPRQEYAPRWSPNGSKILYTSDRDGYYHKIFVMDSDGTNAVKLGDETEIHEWFGSWSPDGQQIVFASDGDIVTMNHDGTGRVNLTQHIHPYISSFPSWSPDGSQIVFESRQDDNVDIYIMDSVDGSNVTRLTNYIGLDWFPHWQPSPTFNQRTNTR